MAKPFRSRWGYGDTCFIFLYLSARPRLGLAPRPARSRVAAGEPGHPIEERRRTERSADPFGRAESGEPVGLGLLVEEIGEAARRAIENRPDVDEPVAPPFEMRPNA